MRQAVLATATLAIVLCSGTSTNAQETGPKKKNGLLGWWHQQSAQYQQNRRRFAKPKTAPAQRTPAVTTAAATTTSTARSQIEQTSLRKPVKRTQKKKNWYQHVSSSFNRQPKQPVIQSQPNTTMAVAKAPVKKAAVPVRNVAMQQSVRRAPAQPAPLKPIAQTTPVRQVSAPVRTVSAPMPAAPMYAMPANGAPMAPVMNYGMYPQTGASMYPSPVPNVPYQMGGTAITNQAFYPQELLYPHTYRSLYAPYYYRVRGGWMVTPFGVRSQEQWELLGTEVEVEYNSQISPFAGFVPPRSRSFSVLSAIFDRS